MATRKTYISDQASIKDRRFVCSWSGGKDCALALYRAISRGGIPEALLTMLTEEGERSRSHGVHVSLYKAQAESLGIRLVTAPASWAEYEESFLTELNDLKGGGVEVGVFGDIDIEQHRQWAEAVCAKADIDSYLPLWGQTRESLLHDLISFGFRATIIAVKEDAVAPDFLGKELTHELIEELDASGVDISGEGGEYHTFVTDGPLFSRPLRIVGLEPVVRDGYRYLDIADAKS